MIDLCGLANGTKLFLDYKEQKDIYLIDDTKITKQEKDKNIYLSDDDIKESIPTSFFGDSLNSVELKIFNFIINFSFYFSFMFLLLNKNFENINFIVKYKI